jgi:uncharacterized protein YbcI
MASTEPPEQPLDTHNGATAESQRGDLSQITRAMIGIYKDQFGRGPRNAHSHYAGQNAIICFLEDTLTPVERSLADLGQHERLRDIRLFFQHSAEHAFRSAVEEITGRTIVGFISGIDTGADIATEIFVFEARSDGSDGRR